MLIGFGRDGVLPLRHSLSSSFKQVCPTFKYHVSCTDEKVSVRINLFLLPIFPPSSHPTVVFLSCRPFVVNTTFSTDLVGVQVSSVSWLGQLTVGV